MAEQKPWASYPKPVRGLLDGIAHEAATASSDRKLQKMYEIVALGACLSNPALHRDIVPMFGPTLRDLYAELLAVPDDMAWATLLLFASILNSNNPSQRP
jgi:hypothetical protein